MAGQYLLTITLLAAVAVMVNQSTVLRERGAMVLLIGVVAFATWYGGSLHGILTVAGGMSIGVWMLFVPQGSFAVEHVEDWFRLFVFAVIGVLMIVLNEERSQSRKQLEHSSRRLSLALESGGVGLMEVNVRTGECWWSGNLPLMVGYASQSFVSRYDQFFTYIHPEDQDRVNRALTTMIEEGGTPELNFRIQSERGEFRKFRARIRALFDEASSPERVVFVFEPISCAA
jgi:PAS domain-containing protein